MNAAPLPIALDSLSSLQTSIHQLYFTFPRGSKADLDPRCNETAYTESVSCEWANQSRIPLVYSRLISPNQLLFGYKTEVSGLLYALSSFFPAVLEAVLSGACVVLSSGSHSIEEVCFYTRGYPSDPEFRADAEPIGGAVCSLRVFALFAAHRLRLSAPFQKQTEGLLAARGRFGQRGVSLQFGVRFVFRPGGEEVLRQFCVESGRFWGDDMQKRLLRSQKLANFDRILVNEVGSAVIFYFDVVDGIQRETPERVRAIPPNPGLSSRNPRGSLPSSSSSRSSSRIPAHSPSVPAGISQSSEFASKTSKTDVSSGFWPISGIPKGGSAKPWSPRRRPSSSVPAIPTFPSRRSTMPFFPSNSRSISRMRVIPAVFAER